MLKNITLSAKEEHIARAREIATSEHKTLNQVFREWLEQYQVKAEAGSKYTELMNQLSHISSGPKKFSREELNER